MYQITSRKVCHFGGAVQRFISRAGVKYNGSCWEGQTFSRLGKKADGSGRTYCDFIADYMNGTAPEILDLPLASKDTTYIDFLTQKPILAQDIHNNIAKFNKNMGKSKKDNPWETRSSWGAVTGLLGMSGFEAMSDPDLLTKAPQLIYQDKKPIMGGYTPDQQLNLFTIMRDQDAVSSQENDVHPYSVVQGGSFLNRDQFGIGFDAKLLSPVLLMKDAKGKFSAYIFNTKDGFIPIDAAKSALRLNKIYIFKETPSKPTSIRSVFTGNA